MDTCEFVIGPDQIRFSTQFNGDRIDIRKIHFTPEQAANLAKLVNTPSVKLKVEIKQI